jgi:catechol 2,3-dioxygenase-like lactoylglutathione lyase family enzyme
MMNQIALITILTDDVPALARFYRDVLGFPVKSELEGYVEFESPGVRFSVAARTEMLNATDHISYRERKVGQAFELAFPLDTPGAVDKAYAEIVAKGAVPVKAPADMPWGQHTAFFADPEGNIHELFSDTVKSDA